MAAIPLMMGGGGIVSQSASSTFNGRLASGANTLFNTSESRTQVLWRTAGVLSLLTIRILTNDRAASTFRTRKDGANGGMSISITGSTTGTFQDAVNTDTVTAGEKWNGALTTGAGGTTFSYCNWGCLFAATTNTAIRYCSAVNGTLSATTVPLMFVAFGAGLVGGEPAFKHFFPVAGTLKNGAVNVFANSRNATTTMQSRVNEANGNIAVSITNATTGWFEDTANSDTIAIGDFANWQFTTAGTSGTITVDSIAIDFLTTSGNTMMFAFGEAAVNFGLTRYVLASGSITWTATENDQQFQPSAAKGVSRYHGAVRLNSVDGSTTFTLRKAGADSILTFSVGASTTGRFEDATHSVSIAATDLLSNKMVTGGASGSITVTQLGFEWGGAGGGGGAAGRGRRLMDVPFVWGGLGTFAAGGSITRRH